MSHGWTHTICRDCYAAEEPGRDPVMIPDAELEPCCFCGKATDAGIYYRASPERAAYCEA